MGITYSEWVFVTPLLRASKSFARFYEAERSNIHTPIEISQVNLPKGLLGLSSRDRWGNYEILLPANRPIDAHILAHEFGHCILKSQGYPGVSYHKFEPVLALVGSFLTDPLIEQMLGRYGFDVRSRLAEDRQMAVNEIYKDCEPFDHIGRLQSALLYALYTLTRQLIGGKDKTELDRHFELRYPNAHRMAKAILSKVNKVGFDTPDKQSELLRWVMADNSLQNSMM